MITQTMVKWAVEAEVQEKGQEVATLLEWNMRQIAIAEKLSTNTGESLWDTLPMVSNTFPSYAKRLYS